MQLSDSEKFYRKRPKSIKNPYPPIVNPNSRSTRPIPTLNALIHLYRTPRENPVKTTPKSPPYVNTAKTNNHILLAILAVLNP